MALASDIVSAWIIIALACALIILAGILMRQRRELKEQNALLRAKESNLRAVMDNAPVEIFLKDADGRYLEINRQFERLLNVTNDEVRGLYPADIHDPGLAERTREHDLHVLRTGKVLVRDERTRTPEGERVLHTIKFPVRDTQGRITGLGAVISDITADVTARDRARQAEQRLVDAVDALPAGFVFVQPDGRVGMTNRLYQDMLAQLGVDPGSDQDFETLVRLLVRHGAVPEAEGREEDWIADRLAFHDRHGNEIEYQMPDGRWFKAYDRPTSDGGMVGIRVDITDLKRQQEILERAITDRDAAERRFHDIAQVSSDWFWEQDKDLRFTFISDGYIRATGGDISGRIGKTREELIDGDPLILESSDWDWLNRQTAAREAFQDFVYGVFDNPEKPIWVRINGSPIYDEAGEFAGYRGVGSDVTDLYIAMKQAENANEAKSAFLANMSHEIRTPLSAVLGMAEELERQIDEPEQRRFVETIRDSGEHLLAVINDILDFSKIEAGKLDIEEVAFRPSDLVDRIISLHTMKAEEKGLSFELRFEGDRDLVRRGDPQRIQQILHNLIGNAIKFTNSGRVTVLLENTVSKPFLLSVIDTGIGMTDEQASRIFEGFSQGDTSIARRFGGTGLGMSITKRLVDAMNGSIDLQSRAGSGTRVEVTLPLPLIEDPDPAQIPEEIEPHIPKGLKVLAVDDNATNRILIDLLLRQIEADATIVTDGASAIDAASKAAFDMILMDIAMPEIDGIEALQAIRRNEHRAGKTPVPALAVTANALKHQIDEYLARGFDGHVAKPIQIPKLFREIKRVNERRSRLLDRVH